MTEALGAKGIGHPDSDRSLQDFPGLGFRSVVHTANPNREAITPELARPQFMRMSNGLQDPHTLELQPERFFGIETGNRHPLGRERNAILPPGVSHIPGGNPCNRRQLARDSVAGQQTLLDPHKSMPAAARRRIESNFVHPKIFGLRPESRSTAHFNAPESLPRVRRIDDARVKHPGDPMPLRVRPFHSPYSARNRSRDIRHRVSA